MQNITNHLTWPGWDIRTTDRRGYNEYTAGVSNFLITRQQISDKILFKLAGSTFKSLINTQNTTNTQDITLRSYTSLRLFVLEFDGLVFI